MSSLREARAAAALAAINGATVGAAAYRSRVVAFVRGELPAIVLKPGAESCEKLGSGQVRRTLELDVEYHISGDVPDQIADPIIVKTHQALMADATLGGSEGGMVEQETLWEYAEGDQSRLTVTAKYHVIYITTAADISKSA